MGCDSSGAIGAEPSRRFNSRTPCGVRPPVRSHTLSISEFQFTHPVWGATDGGLRPKLAQDGFNSRTPCGVRRLLGFCKTGSVRVSIHAPRVGCDAQPSGAWYTDLSFQFTHPVWGATSRPHLQERHPLRFNSRTPCGVRPGTLHLRADDPAFQFTHPVWGATRQ